MPTYIYQVDITDGYLRGRQASNLTGVRIDGSQAVRISDYAPVASSALDMTGLLIDKQAAILRAFPSFTHILGEEFQFSPFAVSNTDCVSCTAGVKEIGIDLFGRYVSTAYTLSLAPSQAMLLFEAYDEIVQDPPTGSISRQYVPLPDDTPYIEARVDFTGALPSTMVANASVFTVGVPGTSFRVRFDNVNPVGWHFIGAWYLLYRA